MELGASGESIKLNDQKKFPVHTALLMSVKVSHLDGIEPRYLTQLTIQGQLRLQRDSSSPTD